MLFIDDTIAAISTSTFEGGIGIVRLSGSKAKEILEQVFSKKTIQKTENRKMYYGHILKENEMIDEVMAVFFSAPRTYTREDMVEIFCHGSVVALREILAYVLEKGARLAEKGEFTKRAFLNGRIDLSQAEAVIDLIKAKTRKTFDVALSQLDGNLSVEISKIRDEISDLLVDITVNIDYPDEDIEEITYITLIDNIEKQNKKLLKFIEAENTGKIVRDGLNVAIIGKPNVGKSSLMNALLKESRAIVTEIPGTTRDSIVEAFEINGVLVNIADTAGIRETEDVIEKIGINKSKEHFNNADLIIFIINASEKITKEDNDIALLMDINKSIVLLNKIDLNIITRREDIEKLLPGVKVIEASLIRGEGINELEYEIFNRVYTGNASYDNNNLITNIRHMDLINIAYAALLDALSLAKEKSALDFIEVDIKNAWEALGEIIGDSVSDDIIDKVFERFCLGK